MEVCVLASGSSGNCVYVGTEKARVLIDAGISTRRIEASLRVLGLEPGQLDAVLVTHEHSDHVSGLGTLARRHRVPIYATEPAWRCLRGSVGEVPAGVAQAFPRDGLALGDLWIESFSTLHDAVDPVGYTFTDGREKAGLLTDTGAVPECVFEKFAGADALVFETNHDVDLLQQGGYPAWLKRRILGERGHLSNATAAEALVRLVSSGGKGMTRVFLAHLSQENNRPDLAYAAVSEALTAGGMTLGREVDLVLTHRDRMSCLYKVG